MPTGNPTASARSERRATSRRRCTIATDSPASGPYSGPTIIAPTIRIGESRKMPTAAIRQRERHEREEARVELGVLRRPRLDLLPDHGVAGVARGGALGLRGDRRDRRVDVLDRDRALACRRRARAGRRRSRSRPRAATSQRITSPSRLARGALEVDHVAGRRAVLEQVEDVLGLVGRDHDPHVDHARKYLRCGGAAPTTTSICGPTSSTRPRPTTSPRQTSIATSRPPRRRGIAELGASEHIHRFTQALDIWQHPFWVEQAQDDLGAYCDFVAADPAASSGSRWTSSPGARTGSRPCSTRSPSTT